MEAELICIPVSLSPWLRPGTQITEPVHVLQAHSDAISQAQRSLHPLHSELLQIAFFFGDEQPEALLLRSSRIPEALEASMLIRSAALPIRMCVQKLNSARARTCSAR